MFLSSVIANDLIAHSVLFVGLSFCAIMCSWIALQIRKLSTIFAPFFKVREAMTSSAQADA